MSRSPSIRAFLKLQKKNRHGVAPIYINVTVDGDEKSLSLSEKTPTNTWDQRRQICTGKSPEDRRINAKILQVKGDLNRLFQNIPASEQVKSEELIARYFDEDPERKGKAANSPKKDAEFYKTVLTHITQWVNSVTQQKTINKRLGDEGTHLDAFERARDEFANVIEAYIQSCHVWLDDPEVEKTLMDAVHIFLLKFPFRVFRRDASHETLRKWVSSKNVLCEFLDFRYKTQDLMLTDIKPKLAEHFKDYLMLTRCVDHNTAMKYIKNTKEILNVCALEGWVPKNPIGAFKCRYIDPEREALTMEELGVLIEKDFGNQRLNEVRDVFVFCCFTGFAYQESYNLRPRHVKRYTDGKLWIDTNRNKTKQPEFLPLLPIVEDIITRYQNHPYCRKFRKLLPVNSNQRYNTYLAEIRALCGIEIELTTHRARHTFATTVALEHDIPLKIVSKMLGHKTIRTTEIYARASKKAISRHMDRLQQELFKEGRDLIVDGQARTLATTQPQPHTSKKVSANERIQPEIVKLTCYPCQMRI
jgi:site-specific recombinase XerD